MHSLIHLTFSPHLLWADTEMARQWDRFSGKRKFPDQYRTANRSYAPAYEQNSLQFSKSKRPSGSLVRHNWKSRRSQVTQSISWMENLVKMSPIIELHACSLSHLWGRQIFAHSSPSSIPPTPPPANLYYQTVHMREQREGQDLPRLLAGVMHKTDPVVYMQRQKERGEGGNQCVNWGRTQLEKTQQSSTALLSSNAADTKLWMQLTVASRSIPLMY